MKIADLEIGQGLIAAPLAGVTDAVQRQLCLEYGADMTVTEMVSAKGLLTRGHATEELLRFPKESYGKPVSVQLFGADLFAMKEAAAHPSIAGFDIIDINMGCPVSKVTRTGAGSALMKTIDRAAGLVRVAKEGGKRPVTVKFRLGYDDENKNFLYFGRAMQDAGADAVTLHARTRAQGYAGTADWAQIAKLTEALSVPVIANGDITDRKSYEACCRATGAAGYMIGRGAMGRPWIFSELRGLSPEIDLRSLIRRHYELLVEYYNERYAIAAMRHLTGCYLRGIPGASKARCALNTADTVADVFSVLDDVFKGENSG